MESQDPLSELADIHLPAEISLWPPAYGWWILLLVLIAAVIYAKRSYFLVLVQRKRLGSALAELDQVYQQYQHSPQQSRNQAGLEFLQGVNSTLRRVALLIYPQSAFISKLSGKAWLDFLDACGNTSEFNSGAGQSLADGIYQRTFSTDADALYGLARNWIEQRYHEKNGSTKQPGQKSEPGSMLAADNRSTLAADKTKANSSDAELEA